MIFILLFAVLGRLLGSVSLWFGLVRDHFRVLKYRYVENLSLYMYLHFLANYLGLRKSKESSLAGGPPVALFDTQ